MEICSVGCDDRKSTTGEFFYPTQKIHNGLQMGQKFLTQPLPHGLSLKKKKKKKKSH